jgi:hypothetical protein
VETKIREYAEGRSQDYETLSKSLKNDNLREHIREELMNRKTYEFIEARAHVTFRDTAKIESGDAEK